MILNKKILILGNGFIASEFYRCYSPFSKFLNIKNSNFSDFDNLFLERDMTNYISNYLVSHFKNKISNFETEISQILETYNPDVVINCIGKTGSPNVDWCETHPAETIESNLTLPTVLAKLTNKKSIHLIHIGSGCINYGESPSAQGDLYDPGWKESDFSNPKSFYSKVKYAADLSLSNYDNVTIFRIRMPVSPIPNQRNLISKLIKYSHVINMLNSITFTEDFVKACSWAIDNAKTGIFNLTADDPWAASDIMNLYKKYNSNHVFSIINEPILDKLVVAKRSNCILDCSKIKNAGFVFSNINMEKIIKEFRRIEIIRDELAKL